MPRLVPRLWSNWLSLLGAVLTTLAGMALLLALTVELLAPGNTYTSSLLFLVLPVLFVLGLLLIPAGLFWARRRRGTEGPAALAILTDSWSRLMREPWFRQKLLFLALATVLNVVLLAWAGHTAVTYMDSPRFCGTACHTVMQPEWTAYLDSPHSRVACVECHIGPGASWAVRSKLDGVRQVARVVTDTYHRPIPTPVHTLRPSRDTCEHCHWPEQFHGNRLALFPHFGEDRANTPAYNLLLLKIGGRDPRTGRVEGIHWHVGADVAVRYVPLDPERTRIGRVRVFEKGRQVAEYLPAEGAGATATGGAGEERLMDCIDCHNRPTHRFARDAAEAVDEALDRRALDPAVPFVRKVAVQALGTKGVPREGAEAALAQALRKAWNEADPSFTPDAPVVERTAATLAGLYRRNVFPRMEVGWGTYESHLGHQEEGKARGCFRCHDGEHATGDGEPLEQRCSLCHQVLAEDADPADFEKPLPGLLGRTR